MSQREGRSKRRELTDREKEMLSLTADGVGAGEIARLWGVNMTRVKRVKRQVKDMLGLPPDADTATMLAAARRRGWVR